MEKDNLIKGMVGILVCIILLGGLLLPVVNSAALIIGDPVTYTNEGTSFKKAEIGDVIVYTRVTGVSDTITYNGEVVPFASGWDDLIMSDGIYFRKANVTSSSLGRLYDFGSDTPVTPRYMTNGTSTATLTITFGATSIESSFIQDEGEPLIGSYTYTWAYIPCTDIDKEYTFTQKSSDTAIYVKNGEYPILCGAYETGEIDTLYYYYNGSPFVTMDGASLDVNLSYDLVDGTTDIYTLTVECTVSSGGASETFTPYRALVPSEVEGHASSGAAYSMVMILPVIAIVSVLIAAIYVFISRKY